MPRRPTDPNPGAAIVRQIRKRGLSDARVLGAMSRLSRARFLAPESRTLADADRALSIDFEQTMSQPFMVAVMTVELALTGTERILEIGTGSGYQTAILSDLAAEVFTVERLSILSLRARGLLDGLGRTNIRYRIGDGSLGWPEEAPFDRVVVTAGVPGFPDTLFAQLAEGGVLVAPIGDETSQELTIVFKRDGRPVAKTLMLCRFVKLIGEEGWSED
jgi:protein-L-isoaspartate(D-aspartate) O-methyltransferase